MTGPSQLHGTVVAAGRTLSQAYPALAAELVTTVRFADSPLVADAVAGAFSGLGYPRWNDLSASQPATFSAS